MTTRINEVNTLTQASNPSKMHDYRMHLRAITDGLVEMAKAAGRSKYTCNQLLRECYNLIDAELKTYEQWKEEGAYVRRGEHFPGRCYCHLRWNLLAVLVIANTLLSLAME